MRLKASVCLFVCVFVYMFVQALLFEHKSKNIYHYQSKVSVCVFRQVAPSRSITLLIFTSIYFQKFYYILNLVIPCMLLSALSLLVFWMSPAAGDKIGFSVTVFLAFSVFMVIVSDSMPTTSKNIPVLSLYLICSMSYCTLYIVLSIVVINMYHQDSIRPIPQWLGKCLFLKSYSLEAHPQQGAEVLEKRKITNNELRPPILANTDETLENSSEPWTIQLLKVQRSILFELRRRNQETEGIVAKGKRRPCLSWQQAAIRLDHILFWIFAFVVFLTNLISLICIQS